jgi:hypothetical protein
MTNEDRERLEQCARALGAKIRFDVDLGCSPWANVEKRVVHLLPDMPGPEGGSFIGAMHELGHVATTPVQPDEDGSFVAYLLGIPADPPGQFIVETRAWLWGVKQTARKLRREEREVIAWSLSTYLLAPFAFFGMYPVEEPPAEPIVEIVDAVGKVDFERAEILDWHDERKDAEYYDAAWNVFLVEVASKKAAVR